jgi:hypothetical protein
VSATQEAALFIGFDNIRYGYLNAYGSEPDPEDLMKMARVYGQVVVAAAYADFSEHPPFYRTSLEAAGITPQDIPKPHPDRETSSTEMAMLMDIVDCLLDRPVIETYVLMTGDSDFVPVVTRARHRFGKQVIIAGVVGTVSQDLVASADDLDVVIPDGVRLPDPDITQAAASEEEVELVRLIHHLEANRPYLTLNFIHSYAVSPTGRLRLRDVEADHLLDRFIEQGLLIPVEKRMADGRSVVNVHLNRTHPLCQLVLG